MIAHVRGEISNILPTSCVVDVLGIGYEVFVAHPYELTKGETVFFYTFHYVKEDVNVLYGFTMESEKELYIKLLSVKGVGPKVAMTIIASTELHTLLAAVEQGDIAYLKKIPGIGPKAAGQIIFDLKGKLVQDQDIPVPLAHQAAKDTLEALGYTNKEITFALTNIDLVDQTTEGIVKQALKKLMG